MKLKGIEDIISCVKCKKIKITPLEKDFKICTDGEITDAGVTEFEIVPEAINFIFPSGIDYEEIHKLWEEENKSSEKLFTFAV